jgi:hypothetical protein
LLTSLAGDRTHYADGAFSPAGARAIKLAIAFHNAGEEIEKPLPVGRFEHRQQAIVGGACLGPQSPDQSAALLRQPEKTRAAIRSINFAVDKTCRYQLFD